MWYTPVSGIWQSVWIESVSDDYVEQLTITPNIDENKVMIVVKSSAKDISFCSSFFFPFLSLKINMMK